MRDVCCILQDLSLNSKRLWNDHQAKRIDEENKKILRKLDSASSTSVYNKSKMLNDWSKHLELVARMSTFHPTPSETTTTTKATPVKTLTKRSLSNSSLTTPWDSSLALSVTLNDAPAVNHKKSQKTAKQQSHPSKRRAASAAPTPSSTKTTARPPFK